MKCSLVWFLGNGKVGTSCLIVGYDALLPCKVKGIGKGGCVMTFLYEVSVEGTSNLIEIDPLK